MFLRVIGLCVVVESLSKSVPEHACLYEQSVLAARQLGAHPGRACSARQLFLDLPRARDIRRHIGWCAIESNNPQGPVKTQNNAAEPLAALRDRSAHLAAVVIGPLHPMCDVP